MKIFILEDNALRTAQFQNALAHHTLTCAATLEGNRGGFSLFDPPYDLILLDHDLGGKVYVDSCSEVDETGYHFCDFMGGAFGPEDLSRKTPILIHSMNVPGAMNMETLLRNHGFRSIRRIPFGPTLLQLLKELPHETVHLASR